MLFRSAGRPVTKWAVLRMEKMNDNERTKKK